eukprot:COSAG03_NODE_2284_length_2919_cov_1.822695_1_plen_130_part_10
MSPPLQFGLGFTDQARPSSQRAARSSAAGRLVSAVLGALALSSVCTVQWVQAWVQARTGSFESWHSRFSERDGRMGQRERLHPPTDDAGLPSLITACADQDRSASAPRWPGERRTVATVRHCTVPRTLAT